jgi:hypothetical protein
MLVLEALSAKVIYTKVVANLSATNFVLWQSLESPSNLLKIHHFCRAGILLLQ